MRKYFCKLFCISVLNILFDTISLFILVVISTLFIGDWGMKFGKDKCWRNTVR
jgi:hypothetical protein